MLNKTRPPSNYRNDRRILRLFATASQNKRRYEVAELDALEAYLDGFLGITDAVERLTASSTRWASDQAGRIWDMVLKLAIECPSTHDNLVNLIRTIWALPKPEKKGAIDWSDEVTGFHWMWRDLLDSSWAQCREMKNISDPVCRQWINFHTWAATCLRSGLDTDAYFGLVLIVEVLEKKLDPTRISPLQHLDIAAAAQYLIYAAGKMLHCPIYSSKSVYHTGWGKDSEFWKGAEGFSLERWNYWKERWEIMRTTDGLSEETREAARRAGVAMEKAERAKKKK